MLPCYRTAVVDLLLYVVYAYVKYISTNVKVVAVWFIYVAGTCNKQHPFQTHVQILNCSTGYQQTCILIPNRIMFMRSVYCVCVMLCHNYIYV